MMKKRNKIIWGTLAGLLCAMLITVLTLSLITVRPITAMGEFNNKKIRVLDSYGVEQRIDDELLSSALGTVEFSIMSAVLGGGTGYKIQPVTYKNAAGDTLHVNYTASAFKAVRPTNGAFMLKLSYDSLQTNEGFVFEDGSRIKYDTVVMIIPKTDDKFATVKLYPFVDDNLNNENWASDEYDDNGRIGINYVRIYEFTAKMNTAKLYEKLETEYTPGAEVIPDAE